MCLVIGVSASATGKGYLNIRQQLGRTTACHPVSGKMRVAEDVTDDCCGFRFLAQERSHSRFLWTNGS